MIGALKACLALLLVAAHASDLVDCEGCGVEEASLLQKSDMKQEGLGSEEMHGDTRAGCKLYPQGKSGFSGKGACKRRCNGNQWCYNRGGCMCGVGCGWLKVNGFTCRFGR